MPRSEKREIIIPHEPNKGPLTSVRRLLVHSSIAELKQLGVYDRYCTLVDAAALRDISDSIGPGWLPVELAIAHYTACDQLQLPAADIEALGRRAGEKLQGSLLVTNAKSANGASTTWEALPAMWRMGRRMYEGSSAQYVKVGEKELVIEYTGNVLLEIPYYRMAQVGFMSGSMASFGLEIQSVKVTIGGRGDALVRIAWA